MPRRLKTDIPGTDWRVPLEAFDAADPASIFGHAPGAPLRLVVDVGFGRGEFLLALAEKDTGSSFLGLEVSHKRVLKMARRLARLPYRNVRLVEGPAELVVPKLPEASVACFWINFPDPWPKKRHHRRRLVQPAFVEILARRLAPGGELHVATDHVDYAGWIGEALAGCPRLENLYAPEPFRRDLEGRSATAYELEWRAEGRALHFFAYRRREGSPP